ncbi:hypothetical protein [Psychroserpens sp. Hel_I_66]|uniref:hypothetical protein n=1 Tax=Psychroserpens sp. Hel_I_66 TaxID=1250004 RepID=UPI000B2AB284|nr:hypothetical protein [Psychroserpens sp. Hel_I_66]
MKTLKITLLLLAVLFLTLSGQSSDAIADNDEPTYKTQKQYDLLAHAKKKAKLDPNG